MNKLVIPNWQDHILKVLEVLADSSHTHTHRQGADEI